MSVNLDNFESEFAQHTPYILTSPTSLRVCAHLGIRPDELSYKSIEEYEDSCCALPLHQIYHLYEKNETIRQEKLLKCRNLRDSILYCPHDRNDDMSKRMVVKTLSASTDDLGLRGRRFPSTSALSRSQSQAKSRTSSEYLQYSDTESQDGQLQPEADGTVSYSSRSVPDLSSRSNLDFRKVLPMSPRQFCPCQFECCDNEVVNSYLKRYSHLLQSNDLTSEDRKIMERLILKKGREMEWDLKSQELRRLIEKERIQSFKQSQILSQRWQDRLAEKRRLENLENARRYLEIKEKSNNDRSELERYLDERDRRVTKYLEDINIKKRQQIVERQKDEALRQLEVGKAIEKLMEEDRQHRQILGERLQKRMTEAEMRKRRREKDYWRHVVEMNRIEDIKRGLKLERVEQKTREAMEELRQHIEEKEHRVRMNYLAKLRMREGLLCQGSNTRTQAMEKARTLHADLLRGLEDWHKKVLELHLAAQSRAQIKYSQEINRRRARVATDRILREERSSELLRRVHETEEQRRELVKMVIQTKDTKSAKLKADKDKRVQFSRVRAQHAAELRQQLKEKLDPETFDKKAARAEMELRFMKKGAPIPPQTKSPGFSVKFNPRLLPFPRCTCRCIK